MKRYIFPAVCVLLVIFVSYSIYCRVIYNSFEYEDEHPYSLAKEMAGQVSAAQQDIADMLEKEEYSWEDMWRIYSYFDNLSSLSASNSKIDSSADDLFQDIGYTFIDEESPGIYADGKIEDNEAEYMRGISELLDGIFINVFDEENSTVNLEALNMNLAAADLLFNFSESSPYLLILPPS